MKNTLLSVLTVLVALGLLAILPVQAQESGPILVKANQLLKNGQGDEALSIYEGYLQKYPTSLEARVQAGIIEARFYQFSDARRHLERALADHPESARAAAVLGHMYHRWSKSPLDNQRDYTAKAEEYLQMAMNLDPDNVEALTYTGMWQLDHGDTVSAERNFQKALSLNPKFIPAYHGLVQFYINARDFKRAKDSAIQAIERDDRDYLSQFYTAKLLAFADYPADALKYAQQSERLDFGQMPERDKFIGEQLEKLGRLEEASTYYERVTKLLPNDAETFQRLAQIYGATGDNQQSTKLYQKAAGMDRRILDDMIQQARIAGRKGQVPQAITQWRNIKEIDPNNPEAFSMLSALYYGQLVAGKPVNRDQLMQDVSEFDQNLSAGTPKSDLDRAKFQAVLDNNVTSIVPKLKTMTKANEDTIAGEAAFLAGDLKTAKERLEYVDGLEAIEYAEWGDRLFLDNELRYAKVFYQRALEMDPNTGAQGVLSRINQRMQTAERKITEGNVLYSEKQYKEALLRYEEAVRLDMQSDTAWLRLADAFERTDNKAAAFDAYTRAVGLSPSLLDSEGFARKYNKLKSKYAPEKAVSNKS